MKPMITSSDLRPIVPLATAWRLLTELQRRHGHRHDFHVVRAHPGSSMEGQLVFLVDPTPGTFQAPAELRLNLGGPTGTYKAHPAKHMPSTEDDFLLTALTRGPADALASLERAMGWSAAPTLPPSSPLTLAMRLVADLLAACWLDLEPLHVEHAWFDTSMGCSIMSWAAPLGLDTATLEAQQNGHGRKDTAAWIRMTGCLRLLRAEGHNQPSAGAARLLVSLREGVALLQGPDGQEMERIDLMACYKKDGRRLAPLVARLREALQ